MPTLNKKTRSIAALVLLFGASVYTVLSVNMRLHQTARNRALIAAVASKDKSAVADLLRCGADPNARDSREDSGRGFVEHMRDLFSTGSERWELEPAIVIAEESGNNAIQRLLLAAGADPNARFKWQLISLFPGKGNAISSGCALVRLLSNADVSADGALADSWLGREVAFGAFCGTTHVEIEQGVYLSIDFVPRGAVPNVTSHLYGAYVTGTVESVDMKNKTIHVKALLKNFIILDTT